MGASTDAEAPPRFPSPLIRLSDWIKACPFGKIVPVHAVERTRVRGRTRVHRSQGPILARLVRYAVVTREGRHDATVPGVGEYSWRNS
jgi:hypothetical protein